MKELRANEFKNLLEMNELLFYELNGYIKSDIPELGQTTYYPKSNKINIHKGNSWEENGFYFIKNHLNIKADKK